METLLVNCGAEEFDRKRSNMFVMGGDLTIPTLEVYAHPGIVGESEVGPLVIPQHL